MISIIIPAHNEGGNLITMLNSLGSVTGMNDTEIIIALSPQSSDYTINTSGFDVKWLRCSEARRAAQMNEGVMCSTGEILVFLHVDVKPPATFLYDMIGALDRGYDAGFFAYTFDSDSFWLKINAFFTAHDGIFTGGGDQCLFIRKSIFEELGRFDEKQLLMEDFEFFKRMKTAKVKYTILKSNLLVSARKYERNSYLRVNISNLLLIVLFKFGYPSTKLKSIHDTLIRKI